MRSVRRGPACAHTTQSPPQTPDESSGMTVSNTAKALTRPRKVQAGIVIVTEWREFIQLNLNRLKSEMMEPIIFDGRNIYSSEQVTDAGFEYYSIGKTPAKP